MATNVSGCTPPSRFHSPMRQEMEVGRDLANQRAFIAEAERLHALRHAHLVPLYGVCLSGSKVRRAAGCGSRHWLPCGCWAAHTSACVGRRTRHAQLSVACVHPLLLLLLLQGILLLEFCAGRDLHSALALKKQGGRGERLFGWYARGRQVALDVAKVSRRGGTCTAGMQQCDGWGLRRMLWALCSRLAMAACHGGTHALHCAPAPPPLRRRSTTCTAAPSCTSTSRAAT